jgi:hypothetical protein
MTSHYYTVNKPHRLVHSPLCGGHEGGDRNLYNKVEVISITQLEDPNDDHEVFITSRQASGNFFCLGFEETTSMELVEKSNPLYASVDLVFLSQIPIG